MIDDNILNQILLPLADQYESGHSGRCVTLKVTPEEFEPFREAMAALRAEGSIKSFVGEGYQFTAAGYAKYAEKTHALRVLARAMRE
jgi:hypothetical protein